MTLLFRRVGAALCLTAASAIAACSDANEPKAGTEVAVKDDQFEPRNLLVMSGQTVTWNWDGSHDHTVTFDLGGPNSTQMATGSFQRQFTTPATYSYHCIVHGTSMAGTVVVQ